MKVKDFELEYGDGIFTCCFDDICTNENDCQEGDIIECTTCGAKMILQERDGVMMWRAYNG